MENNSGEQSRNSLSQVRGDLAAVWTRHLSSHDGLKELPGCTCPIRSGINREVLSRVG